jgi:DNA-binding transcriptional regulator WhiA
MSGLCPGSQEHTESATLDELNFNLREVVQLRLQEHDGSVETLPRLVGLQQVEVEVPE